MGILYHTGKYLNLESGIKWAGLNKPKYYIY